MKQINTSTKLLNPSTFGVQIPPSVPLKGVATKLPKMFLVSGNPAIWPNGGSGQAIEITYKLLSSGHGQNIDGDRMDE